MNLFGITFKNVENQLDPLRHGRSSLGTNQQIMQIDEKLDSYCIKSLTDQEFELTGEDKLNIIKHLHSLLLLGL